MVLETIAHITNKRKGGLSRSAWRWLRRRAAIEPVIGHLKLDTRLDRNYLLGEEVSRVLFTILIIRMPYKEEDIFV